MTFFGPAAFVSQNLKSIVKWVVCISTTISLHTYKNITKEYQKKYEVTYERHISELGKIREAALKKGAFSAANNAEVSRGKAAGLYVEQKIIRTGKLDDMSKEEMETELKKILEEYKKILSFLTVLLLWAFGPKYMTF